MVDTKKTTCPQRKCLEKSTKPKTASRTRYYRTEGPGSSKSRRLQEVLLLVLHQKNAGGEEVLCEQEEVQCLEVDWENHTTCIIKMSGR